MHVFKATEWVGNILAPLKPRTDFILLSDTKEKEVKKSSPISQKWTKFPVQTNVGQNLNYIK